jgi:hypothetical protein
VSKATFVPAVPEVTEVVVKQAAQPEKVVLEMTLEQAQKLRVLVGKTYRGSTGLFEAMTGAHPSLKHKRFKLVDIEGQRIPTLHFKPI